MEPKLCFAALLLWILYFFLYRTYRLSYFRQQLFALRDELFDLALARELDFEDEAYGLLRSTINGTIQYGHQQGFLQILCDWWMLKNDPVRKSMADAYRVRWDEACRKLSEPTRVKVQSIRQRLHFMTAQQVIFTSFTLFATLLAFAFALIIRYLQRRFLRCLNRVVSSAGIHELVNSLDSAAALRAS